MLPLTSWLLLLAVIIIPLSIVLRFYFNQRKQNRNNRENRETS